jgi:hypothetical protein
VFTSFTLSQAGMVLHWNRVLTTTPGARQRRMRVSRAINFVGAAVTALVLVIVIYTKVRHGAWLAMLAMGLLFVLMRGIHRHYSAVTDELVVPPGEAVVLPPRNHAVVLVSRVHLPTMRALAYARATRPSTLVAVTVQIDPDDTERLRRSWDAQGIDVPLIMLDSPYREISRPLFDYLRGLRRSSPRDVVTVFIPEYVVGRWWEQLLHNQSALRLKARLLFEPGVMVTSVPWQLRSAGRDQLATLMSTEEAEPAAPRR